MLVWQSGALVITTGASYMPTPKDPFNDVWQGSDPAELKICRGCSEADSVDEWMSFGVKETHKSTVHPCDGNGCQCPMCDIVRTIREMNENWDIIERSEQWRD